MFSHDNVLRSQDEIKYKKKYINMYQSEDAKYYLRSQDKTKGCKYYIYIHVIHIGEQNIILRHEDNIKRNL